MTRAVRDFKAEGRSPSEVLTFATQWLHTNGFSVVEAQSTGQEKVLPSWTGDAVLHPTPGSLVAMATIPVQVTLIFELSAVPKGDSSVLHVEGYVAGRGPGVKGKEIDFTSPGLWLGAVPKRRCIELLGNLERSIAWSAAPSGPATSGLPSAGSSPAMSRDTSAAPAPPLPGQFPAPNVSVEKFDLKGEDETLRQRSRSFGIMAVIFFAVFLALGAGTGIAESGYPPTNNHWEGSVVIFGGLGSILLWMWLGFSLQRPLADLTVSRTGVIVHDTAGKESRYLWADPSLRLTLSHSLADETAPFRTPDTHWRIVLRPPSSSGLVPDACYASVTGFARSAGFAVEDRKYYQSSRGGGYWMVETAVRPAKAPR